MSAAEYPIAGVFRAAADRTALRGLALTLLALLGLCLLFAAVSVLAAVYTRVGNLTTIWPTNGLAVAAMMLGPRTALWRGGVAAALLVALLGLFAAGDTPAWIGVWLSLGNTAEAVAVYAAMLALGVVGGDRDPVRNTVLLTPVIAAVCAGAALVSLPAAVTLGDDTTLQVFLDFWWQDFFGLGLIVPLALSFTPERLRVVRETRDRWLLAGLLVAAVALLSSLSSTGAGAEVMFVLPLQMIAAVRFRTLGATSALFVGGVFMLAPMAARLQGDALSEAVIDTQVRYAVAYLCLISVAAVMRQRDQMEAALQEKTREAEAADREKSRLVGDISHEMRTPLNAVVGFCDALMRGLAGPVPANQRALLADVNVAAAQLHALADDMVKVADVHRGCEALDPGPLEATDALKGACRRAAVGGREIVLEAAPDVRVLADPGKLAEILDALLGNALVHGAGRVELSVWSSASRVRMIVRDHGLGVPEGAGEAMFRPFNRFAKDAGRYANKGVGLAMARCWAERMGGTVAFDTPPGGGARFWVELPAAL